MSLNIQGNFSGTGVTPTTIKSFNFTVVVNNNNIGTAIETQYSTITYYGQNTFTGFINYVVSGGFSRPNSLPNDNYVSLTSPNFTDAGFSFKDTSGGSGIPNAFYNIYTIDGTNYFLYNNILSQSDPFTFIITASCLLERTKILTNTGQKLISLIEIGDDIVYNLKGDTRKAKRILVSYLTDKYFPVKIEKGILNADEDLFLTAGHAVKTKDGWRGPTQYPLLCSQVDIKELKDLKYDTIPSENDPHTYQGIKYYHIELDIPESDLGKEGNRRKYPLIANGVIVESFSSERI